MEGDRPFPPPPQEPSKKFRSLPKNTPKEPYGLKNVKPSKRPKWWLWALVAVVFLAIITAVGAVLWYRQALAPVDVNDTEKVRIVVEEGSTVGQIGQLLESNDLIKSPLAFDIFARNRELQAGGYALSRSMSVGEIVDHLEGGKFDEFDITLLPGSTIWDIQENLVQSGYTPEEVSAALAAEYDHPLLTSKPADASLEGYIFPDTYRLAGDTTVEELFVRTFDELYNRLNESNLISQFEARNLSLYEALTLASIVQKEVALPEDERQVAQIFYKRLAEDMPLGADATFIYGARVLGVEPRVTLDSPYNTREVVGLPPGPISNMGMSALEAVANPAEGDYLYFVSGDDGTTYFSNTLEEHEEATRLYCHENCAIFEN